MAARAERLLLLHGTPLTPAIWDGVAAVLTNRGSATLAPVVELTDDDAGAADADHALADRIAAAVPTGAAPLHVVGHSFGGQVALDLALRHPARVSRLTLLCTRDSPFPPFTTAAARLRAGQAPDVEAALGRWFLPAELAAASPLIDYARGCLEAADPVRWARALDSIAGFDRTGQTPTIGVPAHVIAAEFDQVSTPAAMSELADRLPRSTFTLLSGAAHLSAFLRPVELANLITGS